MSIPSNFICPPKKFTKTLIKTEKSYFGQPFSLHHTGNREAQLWADSFNSRGGENFCKERVERGKAERLPSLVFCVVGRRGVAFLFNDRKTLIVDHRPISHHPSPLHQPLHQPRQSKNGADLERNGRLPSRQLPLVSLRHSDDDIIYLPRLHSVHPLQPNLPDDNPLPVREIPPLFETSNRTPSSFG